MYMDKEMKALDEQAFCELLKITEKRLQEEKERKEKENGSDTTAEDDDNR